MQNSGSFTQNKDLQQIYILIIANKFKDALTELEKLEIENFPKKNQGEIYWMMHQCKLSQQEYMSAAYLRQLAVDANPNLPHYLSGELQFQKMDELYKVKFDD